MFKLIKKFYKIINHIKPSDHLPRLPTQYTLLYNPDELSDEERIVLSATRARDRVGVQKYLTKAGTDVYHIADLWQLPPIPQRRKRFRNWLMRLLGETEKDWHIERYHKQQQHSQSDNGYQQIPYNRWEID